MGTLRLALVMVVMLVSVHTRTIIHDKCPLMAVCKDECVDCGGVCRRHQCKDDTMACNVTSTAERHCSDEVFIYAFYVMFVLGMAMCAVVCISLRYRE